MISLLISLIALAVSNFALVSSIKSYRETRRQEARTYRELARGSRSYAEMADLQRRDLDALSWRDRAVDLDAKATAIEQRYGRAN